MPVSVTSMPWRLCAKAERSHRERETDRLTPHILTLQTRQQLHATHTKTKKKEFQDTPLYTHCRVLSLNGGLIKVACAFMQLFFCITTRPGTGAWRLSFDVKWPLSIFLLWTVFLDRVSLPQKDCTLATQLPVALCSSMNPSEWAQSSPRGMHS